MSSEPNSNPTPSAAKKTPNDYIFGKLLGEGSFSSVYLAKDVVGSREYAIKVCEKKHILKEKKAESIQREKQVMAILSSSVSKVAPFFVYLYATFQDRENLYFVMTYAHKGDLLSLLNRCNTFSVEMCKFYSAEILLGLVHLHNLNIVHRDLKPENILLSKDGHILITDFGSSKILSQETDSEMQAAKLQEAGDAPSENGKQVKKKRNSFVGTAQYVSPEVLQGNIVGRAADLWAFGCIIYQLVIGSHPFNGPSEYLIFKKIVDLNYEIPTDIDEEATSLIECLLKIDASERLGYYDESRYSSIQSHGFFDNIIFDELSKQDPLKFWPLEPKEASQARSTQFPSSWEPGYHTNIIAQRFMNGDGEWAEESEDTSVERNEIPLEEIKLDSDNAHSNAAAVAGDSCHYPMNTVPEKTDSTPTKNTSKRCICC